MFLLIDNYDSFTYNLLHCLGELGAEVDVRRNDKVTVGEVLSMEIQGIVISPGPCYPKSAGICLELIKKAAGRLPVLGVCLGHQSIGQAFGGAVVRAPSPMHGKASSITHTGKAVFSGIKNPFEAIRYHSLCVAREGFPDCLEITAKSEDGVIQGISHKEFAIHGVQFHPESIASEFGRQIFGNFLDIASAGPYRKKSGKGQEKDGKLT